MNFSHYTLRLAARKMCLDVTEISSPLFSLSTNVPHTLNGKTRKSRLLFPFSFLEHNRHFVLLRDNTTTTTMPSEEQQLAEPLLDDGGNDRFVLFPLKYDAVWEMVRALVILLFLSCLLLCSKSFEISCELLTLTTSPLFAIKCSTRKLKRRSGPLVRSVSSLRLASFKTTLFFFLLDIA